MTTTDDHWFGDSTIGHRFPAWTRGNAADVFPDPFSPLAQWLVVRNGMCLGLRDGYIDIGALDHDEFDDPEHPDLFHMFGGYLYNPLSLTRLLGARMPGVTPELIDQAFFDDKDEVPPYEAQDWHVSADHEARLGASMEWAMSVEHLPELDADKALARSLREQRPELATLTDAALLARARSMVPYIQQIFENAMRISSLASVGPGALGALCEAVGRPGDTISLLAGIEVDSAEPSKAMWQLGRTIAASNALSAAFDAGVADVLDRLRSGGGDEAAGFLADFEQFLFDYGARAANEYDLISPSWEVRPSMALAAIDLMRRSDPANAPAARNAASIAERDRIVAEIREALAGDAETLGMFEAALRSSRVFLSGRERAKTNVVIVINEMRMALREFGRRLVDRGVLDQVEQLFMVTDTELDPLRHRPEAYRDVIAQRWAQYRELFDYEPVFVVNGMAPTLSDMARRTESDADKATAGTVLAGAAGSGGSATGRARIILDPTDPAGLEPGDILIAPQTDPAWVPLFVPAAAVVVNVGAMGSHAMIVSRELGIPCVVSVADATHLIADGATVTVDGNAGTVTIH
ncbi:PEP-utilizing enzyme [Nodularia spumigena]|uniref:PEP-utilizing enzyme n=1 Tax=Nodularia spumigena TaxID=70799 RepID=UPI002B1E9A03|nr:PEP-utilizing enzyme [Nodularia spumigena]MEA5558047.1 PEP-utilizing enzyme [Nodularia spumigena CH309]